MNGVKNLYNNLLALNESRKNRNSFPIHKSLNYEDERINNLYALLIEQGAIPAKGVVLDCGCGVGFGTFLLAKTFVNLNVVGISLSDQEIAWAKNQCIEKGLQGRCDFELRSFDSLEPNSYDCIVAIESVKHSPNISQTLIVLSNAVKPGGKIIIIEDVAEKSIQNFASRRQCQDWHLAEIFTLDHYKQLEKIGDIEQKDLTKYVKTPGIFLVIMRILFGELAVMLHKLRIKKNPGASITRGGFYQEFLYARHKLKYLIITVKRVGASL